MIDILIFSKDRACQLELLIRSILEKFGIEYTIRVLYTTSNDFYEKGYEKLKAKYPSVQFIREVQSFREETLKIINTYTNEHCLFFTDDCVFVKDVSITEFTKLLNIFTSNPLIHTLSLRMNPTVNYCYPAKTAIAPPPEFVHKEEYLLWDWTTAPNQFYCWGYPMAIDNHVYDRKLIVEAINKLQFNNANALEAGLNSNRFADKPLLLSFIETKVFSVQNNFVQGHNKIKCTPGCDVHTLNTRFLDGDIISTENLYGMEPTQAHGPMAYKFTK